MSKLSSATTTSGRGRLAITGTRDAMHKGSLVITPVHVRVRFGEPVETAGLTLDHRDTVAATVRARIQALLDSSGAGSGERDAGSGKREAGSGS